MAKIQILTRYNVFTEKHDVIIDGKVTTNPEIIGCYVLDKVKKQPKPKRNVDRFLEE